MDPSLHLDGNAIFRRQAAAAGQTGAAQNQSNSLSSLVSTLVPVLIVATIFLVVFLLLRRNQRRQYQPRTYLGTLRKEELSPELPNTLLGWIGKVFAIPDTYVLNHHSLDGFLFLRYLKIATTICFVGCCLTWPILFPIHATGGAGNEQLDILSMSNISPDKSVRYYAHVFVSWAFFGFILWMVTREHIFYINLRQAYLLSPLYANRISSRTVLFTSVPDHFLNEAKLRRLFGHSLRNLWIASDTKEVDKLVTERDKVATRLETAETKLVKAANAARLKSSKNGAAQHDAEAAGADGNGESGSVASRFLTRKQRPAHKLKPVIGKKVDTIDWCRSELAHLIPKVQEAQAVHRSGNAKLVNSVFVEFNTQDEAQAAYQTLTHHQPLHMAPRYIGINPEEVIWKNLRIKWWERIVRTIVTTAFVVVMIIFWAIPVAFVGSISQINYLTSRVPFLSFINDVPPVILGLITGLLPVILLAILFALLPIILRLMAKLAGAPSKSVVELNVQLSYFTFLVVQGFLVITVSSSASAVGAQIASNPSSALNVLATNLPKASNFYISYFILQGLTVSSRTLLQLVGLIVSKILGKLLDNTPRKMYKRWATLSSLGWGTVFPAYTLLAVIAITYSMIAPLVLGFATIGLYLIYLAYRYNMLFVYNTNIDTKGLVYPRALQQTLTGVYLAELCLIGLFAIGKAPGPIVLEVVMLIFTIIYHISLNAATAPLLKFLPKSLSSEEQSLLALEDGHEKHGGASVIKDAPDATPTKKPNFFTKWLRPDKFTDYHTLRRLVPRAFAEIAYTPEVARDAYYDPAIASRTPLLWIPRDNMGVSRQEVRETSKVIPMTDEGAVLDDKNKIQTDQESSPPIHEDKVYY
ncbi:MAG: hypothetical protein M1817_005249 [Caeruleum heppii]|nr:MAG: hypothetical protein M1817_005249 [Caeruleum heppii]